MHKLGKLTNDELDGLILSRIRHTRPEVVVRPHIGEDCAALDLGGKLCVLSSDPITAADKGAGRIAVHVACNDIASAGARPIGLMVTLLLPPSIEKSEILEVADDICQAAGELGVDIIGGHTEVTDAVNWIVISTTVVGSPIGRMIPTGGASAGDKLIITKTAGIEGTLIIARDYADRLSGILTEKDEHTLKDMERALSVIPEGCLAASAGASAMHDATEGGVLGAAYEMAQAAGLGVRVRLKDIPIDQLTERICSFFDINPYRLISSGSMLIAARDEKKIIKALAKEGIPSAVIGEFNAGGKMQAEVDGRIAELAPPDRDELYKLKEIS